MKILQQLSFCLCAGKRGRFMRKTPAFQSVKGIAKLALLLRQRLKCGIFSSSRAKLPEFQKDVFLDVRFHASSTVSSD